ncbi:Nn.00g005700.m01.CDS01 [Neocucurbitaria sp. VM-36]
MSPFSQFLILFIAMLFASGSTHAFHHTSFDFTFPGLSFGSWFFAGCCILWSSPQACRALSASVTEVARLIRWLVGVVRDDTIANLRAQIEAFQASNITTNASSAAYHQASQQLREECEVLQRSYDASQASIKTLQVTVDKLQSKLSMYERHYNVEAMTADREVSRHQLDVLKTELSVKEKEIERLQVATEHQRESAATSSNNMYSLVCENDKLRKKLDAKSKSTFESESTLVQLRREMYQHMLLAERFNSFKEIIHQSIEAGGDQMIVVVLFLLCLAEKRVDLAELGVDEAQFLTYKDYAMAVASGRQSPLFPQGHPVPGHCSLGWAPMALHGASQPVCSAPPTAPMAGFTTFSAPSAPILDTPKVSWPAPEPASAPLSAPSAGPVAMTVPPMLPQETATPTAPGLVPDGTDSQEPKDTASQPKQNETKGVTFQGTKRPGSFGVRGRDRAAPAAPAAPTIRDPTKSRRRH